MATFINISDIKVKEKNFDNQEYQKKKYDFLSNDNWYKVSGTLTSENIENINKINKKTYLIFDNTKDLSVEMLEKIKNSNVIFSIVGGNDYINKNKFMKDKYVKRTIIEKEHLIEIIKYFERIESKISKSWNETQKCMFLYDCIIKDFKYEENYDSIFNNGIEPERSLNGILYKKLVCAGFSQVFKEGLDRLGIENYYQNKKGVHDWNIVKLDGMFTGMDITWDCYNKGQYNINNFKWFGRGNDFYEYQSHQNFTIVKKNIDGKTVNIRELNSEELTFDLSAISPEILKVNYEIIKSSLETRKIEDKPILAIERFKNIASEENKYLILYEYLKAQKVLTDEEVLKFNSIYSRRKAIVRDIVGNNKKMITGIEIGLDNLNGVEMYIDGEILTPYGAIVPRNNIKSLPPEKLSEINNLLKERMKVYYTNFLKNSIKDFEKDINKYIKYNKIEKTEIQSILYDNIYSKLNILVNSKETLIEMGIDNNLIENMEILIKKTLNTNFMTKEQQEENQVKNDIDYLYGILSDYDGLRRIAEQYYGKNFTEEEWLENYQSILFMRETFKEGLSEYNVSDEQLQEILNNVASIHQLTTKK